MGFKKKSCYCESQVKTYILLCMLYTQGLDVYVVLKMYAHLHLRTEKNLRKVINYMNDFYPKLKFQ